MDVATQDKDRSFLGFAGPPSPQSGTHLASSSFAYSETKLAHRRVLLLSKHFPILLCVKEQKDRHRHTTAKESHLAT